MTGDSNSPIPPEGYTGKVRKFPPYVPSIDPIWLAKLEEKDRFLVTKLDKIDQQIDHVSMFSIQNHNAGVDLREDHNELAKRVEAIERENPTENRTLLKWVRENLVAPAKLIGWLIAILLGAWLSHLVSKL